MGGLVALVTGASSGFGLLTAVSLAKRGFRVVASMRDPGRRGELERAAGEGGVDVEIVELDVTKAADIERSIADIGAVDVLVNNAGVGITGAVENLSMAEVRQVFETHFFGAVALIKAVLPGMRERRRGRIINVTSVSGRIASPGTPAYIASKHALDGLSDSLRHEVFPFGIHVSIVEPGMFPTAMARTPWLAAQRGGPYQPVEDEIQARPAAACEKNTADPQRVADAIVRAATARTPRPRHAVGNDAHAALFFRRVLPGRMFDAMLRSQLEVKRP